MVKLILSKDWGMLPRTCKDPSYTVAQYNNNKTDICARSAIGDMCMYIFPYKKGLHGTHSILLYYLTPQSPQKRGRHNRGRPPPPPHKARENHRLTAQDPQLIIVWLYQRGER